jgi:5-methylcytosine-specific restriction endonuclease McrA
MSNIIHIAINREQIKDLYFNKNLGVPQISNMLNINQDTLYYRCKKMGIKLRNKREAELGDLNHMYGKITSEETRQRIRQKTLGVNNHFFGKQHTEITKELIRNRLPDRYNDNNSFYGKNHSVDSKRKQSLSHGGTGIPYENSEYKAAFNEKLRNEIRKRDGYECQECGMTQEEHFKKYDRDIEVHHIDYDKENNRPYNLISLCKLDNIKANKNRDYWTGVYTKKVEVL